MAREKHTVPITKENEFVDDFDNDGLDELSDEYDEDERYGYLNSQSDVDPRRGMGLSCCGSAHSSYEINEDSRKDHHNQLERKRRASIKNSYSELREAIPTLRDNKASRSVILQKAVEYLEELQRRNLDHVACVDHFSSENSALENKCREVENQMQTLLRQQRENGYANGTSYNSIQLITRPSSFRVLDEDSNDFQSGSTNSTSNASSSRSTVSTGTVGTNRNGAVALSSSVESQQSSNIDGENRFRDEESNFKMTAVTSSGDEKPSSSLSSNRNETGSNSSLLEYCDDIEEVEVASKKSKKS